VLEPLPHPQWGTSSANQGQVPRVTESSEGNGGNVNPNSNGVGNPLRVEASRPALRARAGARSGTSSIHSRNPAIASGALLYPAPESAAFANVAFGP
jgi:hypothetical protein